MKNFKHPISWATILKEKHISWKIIVQQGTIISLEAEIQGAVNLKHMVIRNFSILYLCWVIWRNLIQ